MSLKHNLQVSVRLKVASKLEHVFEAFFFFQSKMFMFTVGNLFAINFVCDQ